ncbi:glycosyltransferase [Methylicorpusculum oleiharenae]|uniref:glycosyltransferase family 2 protein n=1 Tax=Methylicorpusculum oleiharenae TaxID=1338687 RepID=UPI0013573628|nr:glycosyltransferase family 2 protein [Methylicorpusculum oleiharenae]MCD2449766.1 glycosyltransferase [Methylicorpusculum oleiharenae]
MTNGYPTISIITVCYNSVETIADTIASVASQQYSDYEHIIVDGASSDGTLDIVKNARSVTRYVSERDEGIYDAMNKGISMATGNVIGILNADDVYANTEILQRISLKMERDSLDVLYGDIAFFSPNKPDVIKRRFSSAQFSPSKIAWGWMPAHPSLFIRRSVFEQYGFYKTDFKIAGDYEFVARIFKEGNLRYGYLPEVVVKMRTGGISTGGWRNTMLLNREVLRACSENGITTNWLKILSKYPFKLFEYLR